MDGQGYEQRLGFSLSGEAVSVEPFIAIAEKLTDLLRELETLMTGGNALEWHIADLRAGSAHLAMRPHTDPRSARRVSAWLTLRHLIRVQVARLARGNAASKRNCKRQATPHRELPPCPFTTY